MKNLILAFLFIGFLVACQPKETTPDTLPMKVAMAYGYDKFDEVNSIAYTWNVQVDSARVVTRDWKWNIKDRTAYYADADTSFTYSLDMPSDSLPSAIAGTSSTKLTIVYNGEDGYTPGDAYDLYLDENNMILEWVFRRGNGPDGRPTTWENVSQFGPIKLAQDHVNAAGQKFIWFTNISVN
jgi:hypothetical protein